MSVSTMTLESRVEETADSDLFDLDIRVVETSGQINSLISTTDGGCGSTCGSSCVSST